MELPTGWTGRSRDAAFKSPLPCCCGFSGDAAVLEPPSELSLPYQNHFFDVLAGVNSCLSTSPPGKKDGVRSGRG